MDRAGNPKKALNWRSVVPGLLTILILALILRYIHRNADHLKELLNLSTATIAALFCVALALVLFNGLSNYTLFRGLGAKLTLNEGIGLATVNSMANQLTFATGGLITISVYLKKRFGISYSYFLSAALALYIIAVSANGVMGVLVLGWWIVAARIRVPVILLLGFAAMASSVLLFKLPLQSVVLPTSWKDRLSRLFTGIQTLTENRPLVGKLLCYQFLLVLLYSVQLYISFHTLSQKVSVGQCVLFSAANILTQAISFTPDALGVREAVIGGVATLLGYDFGASVIAVGLSRLVSMPTIITGGSIYAYFLSRKAVRRELPSLDSDPNR